MLFKDSLLTSRAMCDYTNKTIEPSGNYHNMVAPLLSKQDCCFNLGYVLW